MKKIYFSIVIALFGVLASIQNVNAANVVLRAGGNVTTPGDWGAAPNGTSSTLANFLGNNTYSFTSLNSAVTLASTWNITQASNVILGDGVTAFVFNANSANAFGSVTANPPKVTVANNCTLNLNANDNLNTSSSRTLFNTGSTVVYGAGYTNTIKQYNNPYYNLVINTTSGLGGHSIIINNNLTISVAFDMSFGTITVTGNTIINANLTLGGGSMTMGGTISGSGSFIAVNNDGSSLTFNGTGSIGTLNFQAGSQFLSNLTVGGTGTLTLGNDLLIDGSGGLNLTSGSLNLSGHALSLGNASGITAANFGTGTIMGSAASALYITASGFSGSLLMDGNTNTLKALYLNASGQTLSLGSSLNITDSISAADGTIDVTGGSLTLKGTNALKGRVGMMGATGSISGNVTVEIYAPGGNTGWTQLGIGGVTGQTIYDWSTQFPMTCHGCNYGVNSAGIAGFYSIQGWDEAGAVSTDGYDTTAADINANTSLIPGIGYWVYLGTGLGTTNAITITNTGPLAQGNVNVNVTNMFQGYYFVANPYASPISWDKVFALNNSFTNFNSSFYDLYNPDIGNQSFSSGIIAAGQGFFVQPLSNFTMVFNESVKTNNNTSADQLQKTAAATSALSRFQLTVASSTDFDKTEFRFNSGATVNYDREYDNKKRFTTPGYVGYPGAYDHYTSISSRLQNIDYSYNTLPILTNSLSVPVRVKVSASGNYTIGATNFQNYNSCTILKDNLAGTYHDLAAGDYVCTINDTTSAPRFELILCAQNAVVATSVAQLNNASNNIIISQDQAGAFVSTHFAQSTKATISVYNIIGQQIIKDLLVEGTDNTTRLNLDSHNEVLLIRVTTNKETITKKIITH